MRRFRFLSFLAVGFCFVGALSFDSQQASKL